MRLNVLPAELRAKNVLRHRSGEGYKKLHWRVPKSTIASIILKLKFEITRTLPRVGSPAKLSNWGEKGLGKRGDQEPDGHSGGAPEILCWWKKLPERQPYHSNIPPIWLYGRVARRKCLLSEGHMKARLEFVKKHLKDSCHYRVLREEKNLVFLLFLPICM